ncbi:MAG: hypothetical protein U0841_21405 [Chloroflexia bacterium]
MHDERGRAFRAILPELWAIDANLSISNMDFFEFADSVDSDGIFRGFPQLDLNIAMLHPARSRPYDCYSEGYLGERRKARIRMFSRWLPLTNVPTPVLYSLSLVCFLSLLGIGIASGFVRYKEAARHYRLTGNFRPITSVLGNYLLSGALVSVNVWFFWWSLFGVVWFWFGLACGLVTSLVAIIVYLGKIVTEPGVLPLPEAFRLAPEAVRYPNFGTVIIVLNLSSLGNLFVVSRYPSYIPYMTLFLFVVVGVCLFFLLRFDKVRHEISSREAAAESAAMQWQLQSQYQVMPGSPIAPLSLESPT